jgi:SAM-dependent methyltransferase
MRLSSKLLLALNKLFPVPVHPFNLANQGKMSYAEWQFQKGALTIQHYKPFIDPVAMFKGKRVLDIGSGAGGKTLYYASLGVEKIWGIDIVPHYQAEATALAAAKGMSEIAEFLTGDVTKLPFPDHFFDVIIANDVMEHVDDPEGTLREVHRVLRPGGRFYTNFPPYYHPHGAHLSDVIGMPWVHAVWSEPALIEAYAALVKDLPDAEMRLKLRLGDPATNRERITYINKMTIKRFDRIIKQSPLKVVYYRRVPLRGFLAPLAKAVPEFFNKAVVCVLEK